MLRIWAPMKYPLPVLSGFKGTHLTGVISNWTDPVGRYRQRRKRLPSPQNLSSIWIDGSTNARPPALKSFVRPKNTSESADDGASVSRIERFEVSSASQLMLSLWARRRSIDDEVVSTLVGVSIWENFRPGLSLWFVLIFKVRSRRRPSTAGQ